MSILNQIPVTPQDWCKNPDGYVIHQKKLFSLVQWLERGYSFDLELPPDTQGWDKGIDLWIQGNAIDLKSFSLIKAEKTFTWDSEYWDGKEAPKYAGLKTNYYVHPYGDCISEWKVCKAKGLRTSFYGHAPFYWKNSVLTMATFVKNLQ